MSAEAKGSAAPDPDLLAEAIAKVRARIEAVAFGREVRLVVVTKGFPVDFARAAAMAGAVDLGENFADELVEKAEVLAAEKFEVSWHFLGAVQRNKVARLAPHVAAFHGVDRLEEARAIAKRSAASIFVEVDTTGDPGRGGVAPGEVEHLVEALSAEQIAVAGLMTVAPRATRAEVRRCFRSVRALCDALGLAQCSMGMSGDYEIALEEGATTIRLGQGLFGPRARRGTVPQSKLSD